MSINYGSDESFISNYNELKSNADYKLSKIGEFRQ